MDQRLFSQAMDLLMDVTPMKTDCGALCGAACCRDNGEAGSGVWLLPGECRNGIPWGTISASHMPVTDTPVRTLYCTGPCDRRLRPFLCRIFPLTPYYSEKKQTWSVRMDRRAAQICPLFRGGIKTLSPAFVENARKSVSILSGDPDWLEMLKLLQQEESAYRFSL